MSKDKKVLGQIIVKFVEGAEPEFEFLGEIPMISMYGLPYQMSTAYMQHLDKLGDALRRKLEIKGLEEKRMKETVKESTEQTNTEKTNA